MKHLLFIFLLATVMMVWPWQITIAWAGKDAHDHQAGHTDHGAENDDHDKHGHENHQDEDEHGHGGNEEHDDHEYGATEIEQGHAQKAGVIVAMAKGGMISKEIVLNGQITLNRDSTANVRARFAGIVRAVPVRLGQAVQKGDVLARLESNESLRDYTINAPISGVILERNTNIGDVADSETLFVIADFSTVWAKFHIFPKDAEYIQKDQSVRVHTFDHQMETKASIDLFLPTADASSQTHIAIVELDNTEGRWRPGLSVDGHVAVSQIQAPVIIPKTALQTMEEQTVVFVTQGNIYEMRQVKTGQSDGHNVEVLSGLKTGESYVSEGSFIIKADIMKSGAAHEH